MKTLTSTLLLVLLLTASSLANVSQAKEFSSRLGQSNELPNNVQLRFQLLAARMDDMKKKSTHGDLLRFFSDTRVMVWNRPVSPSVESNMRALEQQMVALADAQGVNLDLPPVGYAPRGAVRSRLLSSERITANGLSNVVLQTERLATEVLGSDQSADLLFLRDNLTRMREDLADGGVASDLVRSVLGSRARYLASPSAQNADPRLIQQLTTLGEVLRATFPVKTLRSSRGQTLTI